MAESLTLDKSKDFAIRIVKLYKYLRDDKHEFILSKQLLRSGTSIGANLSEALYGVSRSDFLAKVFISLKECAETRYWLELLYKTDYLTDIEFTSIDNDCTELMKLLTSIVKTTRENS
ncbi:MAG: four helix bundle protein [Muribaculaceae bacterium]|nr:four helix bundle protein [Muribaculaceae bacterium]MBR7011470.1 four helix bundle protein [Muribaculaceae bacterium]